MIWLVGAGAVLFALLAFSFLSPDPKSGTAAIVCFAIAAGLWFELARRFRDTPLGHRFGRANDAVGFAIFFAGCIWLWEYAAWHLVEPTPIFPAPSELLNTVFGGTG